MIHPRTTRDIQRFIKWLRLVCLTINRSKSGFLGGFDPSKDNGHCHTACANFVRTRASHPVYKDSIWVVLGAEGYYEPAHSVIVDGTESAILVDTLKGGFFENGKYYGSELPNSAQQEYHVYAAYRAVDLLELSKHMRDFENALGNLRRVNFHGNHIPPRGTVSVKFG